MSLSDEQEMRLFILSIRLPQPPMTMPFDARGRGIVNQIWRPAN